MQTPHPLRAAGILAIALAAIMLVGCDSDDDAAEDAAENTTDREDGVFYGTPEEYLAANRACFERHGIATVEDPHSPEGFSVDTGGDDDLFFEVDAACREEVGVYTDASVPEEYLEREYEHALWQRECLIELGYDLPQPPTYEHFSQDRDFDPLGQTGAQGQELLDAEAQCPGLQEWDRQQGES